MRRMLSEPSLRHQWPSSGRAGPLRGAVRRHGPAALVRDTSDTTSRSNAGSADARAGGCRRNHRSGPGRTVALACVGISGGAGVRICGHAAVSRRGSRPWRGPCRLPGWTDAQRRVLPDRQASARHATACSGKPFPPNEPYRPRLRAEPLHREPVSAHRMMEDGTPGECCPPQCDVFPQGRCRDPDRWWSPSIAAGQELLARESHSRRWPGVLGRRPGNSPRPPAHSGGFTGAEPGGPAVGRPARQSMVTSWASRVSTVLAGDQQASYFQALPSHVQGCAFLSNFGKPVTLYETRAVSPDTFAPMSTASWSGP